MEYFKKEGGPMKTLTYLDNEKFISKLKEVGIKDVILEPRELARMGRLNKEDLISLAKKSLSEGLRPLLQWDILMTEDGFKKAVAFFKALH